MASSLVERLLKAKICGLRRRTYVLALSREVSSLTSESTLLAALVFCLQFAGDDESSPPPFPNPILSPSHHLPVKKNHGSAGKNISPEKKKLQNVVAQHVTREGREIGGEGGWFWKQNPEVIHVKYERKTYSYQNKTIKSIIQFHR